LEFCVAIALIVVGVLNVRASEHDRPADLAVTGARRAFFVGLVHGLAGSAAVALLVLATVDNARWGFAYLLVFGAGTMIGMMLITTGLAVPVAAVSNHRHGGHWIRFATGGLSLVMGVWLAYRIGWHDGLFLAAPIWTPR
jgi:high-affinity nickel-transport protein